MIESLYSHRDDRDAIMIKALCNQLKKFVVPNVSFRQRMKKAAQKTEEGAYAMDKRTV